MEAHPNLSMAMDFMTVNLKDLPWLPGMVRPLDMLFKREQAGWEADEEQQTAAGEAAKAVAAGGSAAPVGSVPVAGK